MKLTIHGRNVFSDGFTNFWLQVTKPAAISAESVAAIAGSGILAPTGISSKHASGGSGAADGVATPFSFRISSSCFFLPDKFR